MKSHWLVAAIVAVSCVGSTVFAQDRPGPRRPGSGEGRPGPGGPREDMKKLEDEVAKLRGQLKEMEERLKKSGGGDAKKDEGRRPPFGRGGFGGPEGDHAREMMEQMRKRFEEARKAGDKKDGDKKKDDKKAEGGRPPMTSPWGRGGWGGPGASDRYREMMERFRKGWEASRKQPEKKDGDKKDERKAGDDRRHKGPPSWAHGGSRGPQASRHGHHHGHHRHGDGGHGGGMSRSGRPDDINAKLDRLIRDVEELKKNIRK